ncbi:hypothetical protein SUDANB6_03482 [Streptomyces sp. enrichment culture]
MRAGGTSPIRRARARWPDAAGGVPPHRPGGPPVLTDRDLTRPPRGACSRTPVAEGRSSGAIARELVVSEAAAGKHIGSILAKPDLPPAGDTHRRVPAVPAFPRA